jgi:hypothetical protein
MTREGIEMERSGNGDLVIETHGLTKRYGNLVAVDGLTMRGSGVPSAQARRRRWWPGA